MIEIDYTEPESNVDEILRYSQLISDAFSKALDQNECNLKVVVGLAQEIEDRKKDVEDLWEIMNPVVYIPTTVQTTTEGNTVYQIPLDSTGNAAVDITKAAIKNYLNSKCIDCGLGWPSVDFNSTFDFSMNNLRASLDAYLNALGLKDPNLCHAAGMFEEACLADLLKIISLLLSVYSSILALRKLGSISLSGFIKGIISGILEQLMGNITIRVDTSKTGLACLVTAFKQYSLAVFSNNQVDIENTEQLLEYLGYTEETTSQQILDSMKNYLNSSSNIFNSYVNKLEKQQKNIDVAVSNSVGYVTNTLNEVIELINEETNNLFGLLDYFQCEFARSGTDFTEVANFISRLVNIINLVSSLIAIITKKQVKFLCKTKASISNLTTEDVINTDTSLTDLDATELIEEYLEKVVEVTKNENDSITPIIYDTTKEPILPKLDFYNCNLKEFIEAHKIENVIDSVVKEIVKESVEDKDDSIPSTNVKPDNNSGYFDDNSNWLYPIPEVLSDSSLADKNDTSKGSILPIENVSDKNNWKEYPILYIQPQYIGKDISSIPKANLVNMVNMTDYTIKSPEKISKDILADSSGNILSINNGMKDILDFVYNNPLLSNSNSENISESELREEVKNNSKDSSNYKDDLKITVDKLNKKGIIPTSPNINKSYENKCKDINDVLTLLSSIDSIKGK